MSSTDVVVLGAGPHGVSIAAHLAGAGIAHRIFGESMGTWRAHMPAGMMLRSEPYGSDFSAPVPGWDMSDFHQVHGLDYVERLGPLPVETFLDYAQWFIDRWAPNIENTHVLSVAATDHGFRVRTATGEEIDARQVVVATGVAPYVNLPVELAALPAELASHTIDHHDLTVFRGKSVAVVGGGQSAMETAALLNEAGADVHVVARRPQISWLTPNPAKVSRLGRARRPVNKLCEGWHCAFWNSPPAFRRLPAEMRVRKAKSVLGPAGAWWLKDRVVGHVELLTGHELLAAHAQGSGVRLDLAGPIRTSLDVDHVLAGTGFHIDINRLAFLERELQVRIDKLAGSPVLDRACESSVPGLFFMGAPAAVSNGPSMRFVAGTHTSAPWVARRLVRSAGRTSGRPTVAAGEPLAEAVSVERSAAL
jgi:FAD-dependent urate hydroxylase